MAYPRIGYNNLIESASAISVTSEAAGFEKENAYDWLTYDWWKASAAGTVYYTIDLGSAQSVDYWALAAHTLADVSGSIKLQYSSDNFSVDTNDVAAAISPSDNKVLFRSFTSISARYWRFEITATGSAAAIGALSLGTMLEMPEGLAVGFIPPHLGFNDSVTNHQAHGGAFLGRSVKRLGIRGSLSIAMVTPAWVRASWEPFLDHAREKPFFLSWDEENYQGEAVYCWTNGKLDSPRYSQTTYMSVSLDYAGITA